MSRADAAADAARNATAVDRVADAVRDDILSGRLGPDAPLREEAAAAQYAVSRHTVRAAFQRLASERLAVALPYRGVRVAAFDRESILALHQYRSALEVEAIRIASERHGRSWPDAVLAPARAALGRFAECTDWVDAERVHLDLHRALVAASESPRIIEAHAAIGSEILLFLLHVRPHYTLETLIAEHRVLIDEVQSRGPDAIREHLAHSYGLLSEP
ncbi:DNA-binding transcriptional regulator, GntR family [Agromyces sp. CF514]|uniref:GntR family transcriptional regulator n=1 Tax=Agromyces sp. CF514 TaxID=1881031 RepID=UPI0008F2C70E|nr:GntR family transcriptional regulator [Agromyces sp. CF514]SFR68142.1 DNA-binding transcriptional regulator, GntR family [Agromyces sp. CF514]